MTKIPLKPHFKKYRGPNNSLRLKTIEYNNMARQVANHVNILIASNPDEVQHYKFDYIASDLGTTLEVVRDAISDGGNSGITFRVRNEDRPALAIFYPRRFNQLH